MENKNNKQQILNNMKKQITVLFAGGIGSGKSTVLGYIQECYGIPVFYSDYEAKELYRDPKILAHVNKIVGGGIITKEGSLDKVALAKIIFNDADKKKKLEAYIHPKVRKRFNEWRKTKISPIVIMESAIALQKGRRNFDYVVFVDAPESVRVERVMKRDHSSRGKVLARIESQKLDSSLADFIIDNKYHFKESTDKCIVDLLDMMASKAMFAGSFDPFTNGHLSILKQACARFDVVYLCIAKNPDKKSRRYDINKMKHAMEETVKTENLTNCRVITTDGLVAKLCLHLGVSYVVRGLRNTSDYLHEENLINVYHVDNPGLKIVYFRGENDIISSSMVHDRLLIGEPVDDFVPDPVMRACMQ